MATTCPLCASTATHVVHRFSPAEAAQHFVIAEHEPQRHGALADEIARLWNGGDGENRLCDACGFGFAEPFVAGSPRFYELAFGASGYLRDKWEFRRTIEALVDFDFAGGSVLEIGAGYGYFLDRFDADKVPPARRHALEYNAAACRILSDKGYETETADLADLRARGRRYRAVFMFQVLEHRDKIDETFGAIRGLLDDDGRAYFAVPNVDRVRFNEANDSLHDMPPNHIGRWTEESFRRVAARHGFAVTAVAKEPFDARDFVRMDLIYSFMRRAQQPGTLANRLYPRRKQPLARLAVAMAIAAGAVSRLPLWLRTWRKTPALGTSLWVELRPVGRDSRARAAA